MSPAHPQPPQANRAYRPDLAAVSTVAVLRGMHAAPQHEHKIPMRDGVKLHTTLYIPKLGPDGLPPPPMPFLMQRSPYSSAPYGSDTYPAGTGFFERFNKEFW